VADEQTKKAGWRWRVSAWLPPGLALGWLAVLGTFVHGPALLAAWSPTVCLAGALAWRLSASTPGHARKADGGLDATDKPVSVPPPAPGDAQPVAPPIEVSAAPSQPAAAARGGSGETQAGTSGSAVATDEPTRPSSGGSGRGYAEAPATLGLRVHTAAEVASALRVDAKEVVTAISNGELPGNQLGDHWLVERQALIRWLQGKYAHRADWYGSSLQEESQD
jgi:excisionase family DNA binding protein